MVVLSQYSNKLYETLKWSTHAEKKFSTPSGTLSEVSGAFTLLSVLALNKIFINMKINVLVYILYINKVLINNLK